MRQILKIMLALLLVSLLALNGLAQEQAETDADNSEPRTEESTEDAEDTESENIDDESYLDIDDDDFRPSEEIPADQSIDFPTDI